MTAEQAQRTEATAKYYHDRRRVARVRYAGADDLRVGQR